MSAAVAEAEPAASRAAGALDMTDERVRATVRKAAARKAHLFAFCPDITKDDLVQEGLLAVAGASGFNPEAGALSTFVYTVASRKVIDLWRARSRQNRRECETALPETVPGDTTAGEGENLVEWCARVRSDARRLYGHTAKRMGRKFYRVDEMAALVLLQQRLKLSAEGMHWLLQRRPELLEPLGFLHVPPLRMLTDAAQFLRRAIARGKLGGEAEGAGGDGGPQATAASPAAPSA